MNCKGDKRPEDRRRSNGQARVLTADSALVVEGVTYVINDEFLNTYQKVNP